MVNMLIVRHPIDVNWHHQQL